MAALPQAVLDYAASRRRAYPTPEKAVEDWAGAHGVEQDEAIRQITSFVEDEKRLEAEQVDRQITENADALVAALDFETGEGLSEQMEADLAQLGVDSDWVCDATTLASGLLQSPTELGQELGKRILERHVGPLAAEQRREEAAELVSHDDPVELLDWYRERQQGQLQRQVQERDAIALDLAQKQAEAVAAETAAAVLAAGGDRADTLAVGERAHGLVTSGEVEDVGAAVAQALHEHTQMVQAAPQIDAQLRADAAFAPKWTDSGFTTGAMREEAAAEAERRAAQTEAKTSEMVEAAVGRIDRSVPLTAEQVERAEINRAKAHADATTVMSAHQRQLTEWSVAGEAQRKLELVGAAPAPELEAIETPGTNKAFVEAMRRAEANVQIGEPETVAAHSGDSTPERHGIRFGATGTKSIGVTPDATPDNSPKPAQPTSAAEKYARATSL